MFAIASHNNGEGARALAEALGCRLLSLGDSSPNKPIPRSITHVINLGIGRGSGKSGVYLSRIGRTNHDCRFHNTVDAIAVASSKLATLEQLRRSNARTVPYMTSQDEANYQVLVEGKAVVARTLDRASEGRGIELLTPDRVRADGGLIAAPLYTLAIDKGREYRVHVGVVRGGTRVIDIQRKIRRPGVPDNERPFVWNHGNDFIFVRDDVNTHTVPADVIHQAKQAVLALGLDFGAVDIITGRRGRTPAQELPAYVLEVNTAPGMTGRTVERYAHHFRAAAGLEQFTPWAALPNDTETEEI